ncbi:MAG TPA: cell wall anchor protein, partial [Arthrobacter sp.]
MHSNLRRGLLSTLFAGGLLALGATAASAADTTSGSDLTASALVSAATSANTTSLGLLGGSTPSDTADVAAV